LLPGATPRRRLRCSASWVVPHVGPPQGYPRTAHPNIHFGRSWRRTFDELTHQGHPMGDPSLLVTNASRTDPALAPAGRHTYCVLAPVPNLALAPVDWDGVLGKRYAEDLIGVLQ